MTGNKLMLDRSRTCMVLSFTFKELGQVAISNGTAWITPVVVRSNKIDEAAAVRVSKCQRGRCGPAVPRLCFIVRLTRPSRIAQPELDRCGLAVSHLSKGSAAQPHNTSWQLDNAPSLKG